MADNPEPVIAGMNYPPKRYGSGNVLVMRRVPKKTFQRFQELADDENFCEDYGMTLKYLIDFHDGVFVTGYDELKDEITRLREEIKSLKPLEVEQNQLRRRLDGKVI